MELDTATTTATAVAKIKLFAGLDQRALDDVTPCLRARRYDAEQIIALEGDPGGTIYLLTKGVVRLRQSSAEGRAHVLTFAGPGDSAGLGAALDGETLPATVQAVSPVVLYTMPAADLLRLMGAHPALALAVARQLADEVRRLNSMVRDLALHPVRTRLARFLLQYAESGQGHRLWSQAEIAAQIGTVRDVVGRVLRSFMAEGLIRRQRGRLVVADRAGLEREAQRELDA